MTGQGRLISAVLKDIEGLQSAKNIIIAIEGGSASGKSTLGAALAGTLGANLFHTDDYFLPGNRKTPERLAEPGGNIDYERFKSEIITPLCAGENIIMRRFDCHLQRQLEPQVFKPSAITIIEGAYSCHPYFGDIYTLRYFLEISPETRRQRILDRNGAQMLNRFETEWIPLENKYFAAFGIKEKCRVLQSEDDN